MRDLAAEVHTFLSSSGPSTATEIGLGVRARRQAVQAVVAQDGFERVERPDGANPRGEFYNLSRPGLRGESGTNDGPSQCQRVLEVLRDGRPHTATEIHRAAGTMRLNSRISELRKRGNVIECRRLPGVPPGPDAYEYELLNRRAA